jgi:hypothetical protein
VVLVAMVSMVAVTMPMGVEDSVVTSEGRMKEKEGDGEKKRA